jgi:hypothetical protein
MRKAQPILFSDVRKGCGKGLGMYVIQSRGKKFLKNFSKTY